MNWDDLRHVLAVARHGRIKDAALALDIDPTTMSRRLRGIEKALKTELFEKFKHGVVLTAAGEEMVATAEAVERLTHDLDARVTSLDTRLEGPLRVTSTDALMSHWLSDFGEFHGRYPKIELALTPTQTVVDLDRREADVALRAGFEAPGHLVGRKYARFHLAVYGSEALLERVGANSPLGAFPWLAWSTKAGRLTDRWIAEHAGEAQVAMRLGHIQQMVQALVAGFGISLLPCLVGDSQPDLRRVGGVLLPGGHLWILTHPRLRGSARVRAFVSFVRDLIERDRDLIEGRRPVG